MGGLPRAALDAGGSDTSTVGLTGWLPVYLPLACFSAPIPSAPFPAGRGRIIVFSCKGLRPLHPRGWEGSDTGGGWKVVFDRMACPQNRARTPGYGNNNSFGKVLGVRGTLSRVPRRISPYLPVSPPPYPRPRLAKKEGTAHEGRFRGMITRRSDRSARCPAPGSSGRRHTG